jgi:hypothetical protein
MCIYISQASSAKKVGDLSFYMSSQNPISRRQVISGLGTGLVAVAAPRIFAAEGGTQANIQNRLLMVNCSLGRAWRVKWIRVRIMARKATRAQAV